MTELMSPAESFNFLNSYLSRVGPIVRQHHGFIDKYIGDAVMALFPASADDSIQAAIAMQQAVQQYNHHRSTSGYTAIAIGIGVHTGHLMLGTIGEQERMESTVIADAVNLSSRLERLTKLYGVNILTTASTVMALDDATRYNYRFLDRVQVRGKNEQVSVWEFFDGDRPECMKHKSTTRTQFEQAVCAYHSQQFDEARAGFESVIEVNPNDTAAHLYIKRCQRHQRHGAIEEWEQFS
jgi:two-component system sensor histidine kinase ChiS